MFKIVLLGFLVFTVSVVLLPTKTYAISLDDEEEDAEDVADLLDEAKKAGKSESFSKANELLEKAKMYGTGSSDVGEAEQYVSAKKQARDERLERLARLKREKEERARQARLAAQRQRQNSSSGYSGGGSIGLCVPSVPYKCCKTTECRAKSASGKYENVTVELKKDFIGGCYTLSLYGGNGYGGGYL